MKKALIGQRYHFGRGYNTIGITLSRGEYHDYRILILNLYKISFERHIKKSFGEELEYGFYWDLNDRVIRFYYGSKCKSFSYMQEQLHNRNYYIDKITKFFNKL